MTVWHEPGADLEPVEIPLPMMIDHLKMEPVDLGEPWYLLFAGRKGQLRGGCGDLAGSFRCLEEGRAAFVQLQQSTACGTGGWAELVALEPNGQLRQVCWAGEKRETDELEPDEVEIDKLEISDQIEATVEEAGGRPAGRWRRRLFGAPEASV